MVDTELSDQLAGKVQEALARIASLLHARDEAYEFNLAARIAIRHSRDILEWADECMGGGKDQPGIGGFASSFCGFYQAGAAGEQLIKINEQQDSHLAVASRHVAQGRIIVARQRERIARLKALGCDTLDHEQTLTVFLSTLEIFIDHERTLRKGGAKGDPAVELHAVEP